MRINDEKNNNSSNVFEIQKHKKTASSMVNQSDNNLWTALHHVCKLGYLDCVKILVELG
tara:strand:- start:346 stop:522 length:177 start_codon:yes stop_codon:yes gene_type:complete